MDRQKKQSLYAPLQGGGDIIMLLENYKMTDLIISITFIKMIISITFIKKRCGYDNVFAM